MQTTKMPLLNFGLDGVERTILLKAALLSPLSQVGGLIAGIAAGAILHGILPGHNDLDAQRVLPAAGMALLGLLGGGVMWGVQTARLANSPERKRAAGAGAIWAVLMITVMLVMQVLEPVLVAQGGLALHHIYTLLFIPAVFLVGFVTAWAMAVALRRRERVLRRALITASACALMYLVTNIAMDLLGWRVGASRAAERFTMLTVTLLCTLAASVAGGATLVAMLYLPDGESTRRT
jgi:hypothetical protein